MIEEWNRHTAHWVIFHFPNSSRVLTTFVKRKDTRFLLGFGALGVSHEELENLKDESLDLALSFLSVGAMKDGWTVCSGSFWNELNRYAPELKNDSGNCVEPSLERFSELAQLFQREQ